jgi:type IX secretion system PorP/SprF family membrane protein
MRANNYMKFNFITVRGLGFMILLLLTGRSFAQQDPMYTQYNFNTQTINPAYAGTWDNIGFLVLGRHQWTGIEGAPKTYTFSLQSPTRNRNVALGFNIISDKVGLEKRLSVSADYSYRLQLNDETYLRLGLKGGVTNYMNNLTEYTGYPGDTPDPVFLGDVDIRFMPNFGIGTFLYGENYYIGFSIPKIIQNEFKNNYNNYSAWSELRHFFVNAGYVFDLSEQVKFKPTFLTKAALGAPVEVDLTANFLLGDKVWLGAMYRTGDSFGFIAQWIFDNNLRVGYSVDFTTTRLQHFHNGTHEVMVSYELPLARRRWSTPRMF